MKFSLTCALLAAALFGASTPFAKLLGGEIPPVLLAGLLYLGSGLGLAILRILRDGGWISVGLSAPEWRWLIGAIAFGGIAGVAGVQGKRRITLRLWYGGNHCRRHSA